VTNGSEVIIFTASHVKIIQKTIWEEKEEQTMKTIKVKGMSCNHCVMAVTRALNAVDGIDHVKVSLETGEATFDEIMPVDMAVIQESIRKAGFEVD
jgi:copper chaperone